MKPHYHYLLSISLVVVSGLWFVFPLNFGAISTVQSLHLIITFLLAVLWLSSFSFQFSMMHDGRSHAEKLNQQVQSKIFVLSVLFTGVLIYIIS